MQGNYTYQRQWGLGWDPYNSNYYEVYNRAAGEGYSNTLPRQQWTFAQNYDIPVGKGRKYMSSMNRVEDALIGGWNLSGVTTYYSGFPFSPTLANSYAGQPNTGPNRPARNRYNHHVRKYPQRMVLRTSSTLRRKLSATTQSTPCLDRTLSNRI